MPAPGTGFRNPGGLFVNPSVVFRIIFSIPMLNRTRSESARAGFGASARVRDVIPRFLERIFKFMELFCYLTDFAKN